jgi:hypothetical protein
MKASVREIVEAFGEKVLGERKRSGREKRWKGFQTILWTKTRVWFVTETEGLCWVPRNPREKSK